MILAWFTYVRRWLINLNLFESGRPDPEIIWHERWSTRIYICLLLGILYVLVIYKGLGSQMTNITVKNPSKAVFDSLQRKYPDTLNCPCSIAAIKYEEFVKIRPTFHQVCSSSFISQEWILAAYEARITGVWPMDIRTVSSAYAQFLRSFCNWSRTCSDEIVSTSLANSFVNPQALSFTSLQSKVNEQIEQIRFIGPWMLTTSLLGIRFSTMGNQLMNGLGTDSFVYIPSYGKTTASVAINTYKTRNGSACKCYPTSNCLVPAAIYSNPLEPTFGVYDLNINSTLIKGMRTACHPLEGLLSSTLECYFDPFCLELLVPNSTAFIPLNSSQASRFSLNTTVENLINELMVEEWPVSIDPEGYYTRCAPSICTYSYVERSTLLSITTTIISIFGGLNVALRLTVPYFLQIILKLKRKFSRTTINSSQMTVNSETVVIIPVRSNAREKLLRLWTKIKGLNFFNSGSDDPSKIRRQQIMSRLYVLILIISSTCLFTYNIFTEQTITYTVEHPIQTTYEGLLVKYPDTLQCPCTRIAIPHQEFISVKVYYHQICSSEFISDMFISQLFAFRDENMYRGDFMQMSGSYFSALRIFCSLSQTIFLRSLTSAQTRLFVNEKLLSPIDFATQAVGKSQSFIYGAAAAYGRDVDKLLELTLSNQALSVSPVAYNLDILSNGNIQINPSGFSNCSCLLNAYTCSEQAGFYSYNSSTALFTRLFTVMGIQVACLPILSIMESNLACWYSAECYEMVIKFWQNKSDELVYLPSLLNQSIPSRFDASTSLSTIIGQLMIEGWSNNASYSSFFTACDPSYCTYEITERNNIILIVTVLFGVFSGLNILLKLLIPLSIRSIFWFLEHVHDNLNVLHHLRQLSSQFVMLNLFYNRYKSSVLTLRRERHATILYITLFILIFTVLIFYNSLVQVTVTITVPQPTQKIYEHLVDSFGSTLQCPCSRISIAYGLFLDINIPIHQVCSSPFVETTWIENMFDNGNWSNLPINEFRSRGVAYFVVLQTLCNIAQQYVDEAAGGRLLGDFYNKQCIPEQQFLYQVISEITKFRQTVTFAFAAMLQYARDSSHDSQLLTVYSSNWIFSAQYSANTFYYALVPQSVSYGPNCSCATSSACTQSVFINEEIIPGFVLGCISFESLLRSSLICLYNQTCLDLINFGNLSTIRPLDASLPSLYWPNTTVDQFVTNMFMEQWSYDINYANFFSECQPSMCSYLVSEQRNPLQIISILLGIYSGLTTILYAVAPYLIAIFNRIAFFFRRRNNTVIPFA